MSLHTWCFDRTPPPSLTQQKLLDREKDKLPNRHLRNINVTPKPRKQQTKNNHPTYKIKLKNHQSNQHPINKKLRQKSNTFESFITFRLN